MFRDEADLKKDSIYEALKIVGVPSLGYRSNISISRIAHEFLFGFKFLRLASKERRADVVVLADPSLFFGWAVEIWVARSRGSKLVVDVMDLWPEMFESRVPPRWKSIAKLMFSLLYRKRSALLSKANGLVAVAPRYAKLFERARNTKKETFVLGVDEVFFSLEHSRKRVPENGNSEPTLKIIFAGTMGAAYGLAEVQLAVAEIAEKKLPVQFKFIGDGPEKKKLESLQRQYPNHLQVLNSLPLIELVKHYEQGDIGLCSYSIGSTVTLPTKFFDLIGSGLAIITSLNGDLADLTRDEGLGIIYEAGNSNSLVEAIYTYLGSRDLLEMHKRNSKTLSIRYRAESVHERYAIFLEEINEEIDE